MIRCYPGCWNQEFEPCTSSVISGVVVQGWWVRYEYAIPLCYYCYMRYGPHLTEVDHPTADRPHHDLQLHHKHAQMLPWFSEPRAWTIHLTNDVVVQGWWHMYGYTIPLFWVLYEAWITSDRGGSPHSWRHDVKLYPRHTQVVTLVFVSLNLNHVPPQWWCSGSRILMIYVWIFHVTIFRVLYELITYQ